MGFKLRFSADFYSDLDDAMDYAVDILDSPGYAYDLWQNVYQKVDVIEGQPFLYPLYYHNETIAAKGFRYAVVGDYLLFYRVIENDKIVRVESLIHGKRNLSQVFTL